MPMQTPTFDSLALLIHRIQSEYREMPGLRVTPAQAERLWGLEAQACIAALQYLVDAQFLCCTTAGEYVRLTDGPPLSAPLRVSTTKTARNQRGRGAA